MAKLVNIIITVDTDDLEIAQGEIESSLMYEGIDYECEVKDV